MALAPGELPRELRAVGSPAASIASAVTVMVRGSAHAFAASIVGLLLGVGTTVVISRTLGPSGKGAYDLAFATATLVALVIGLSMPSGITYAVARGLAAPARLVVVLIAVGLLQACAAVALVGPLRAAGLFGRSTGGLDTGIGVAIAIGGIAAGTCVSAALRATVMGRQRLPLASWLDASGRAVLLLTLVIVVFGIVHDHASAGSLIAATAVASVVSALIYIPFSVRGAPWGGSAGLRTVMRYALPSYGANVLQFLNYRLDLFLVGYFRGTREVGLYALAATLAQLIWMVSNAVSSAVLARVSLGVDPPADSARRTAMFSRYVFAVQALLAVLLGIAAKPVLELLYGRSFASADGPLLILLPGVATFGVAAVIAADFSGRGRPGINVSASFGSFLVTLALDFLLIPSMGMTGAAIASTASYATATVILALFFRRSALIRIGDVFLLNRSDLTRALEAGRMVRRMRRNRGARQ